MNNNNRANLLLIIFCLVFINPLIFGQNNIYIPRNILKAYKNGTRSFDGKPGENYWQNSSNYSISVSINPETRLLTGSERITYHNNSRDTLKFIVFRLYQNMNKKNAARNSSLDERSITDGDIIDDITVDGDSVNLDSADVVKVRDTNLYLNLPKPLSPQDLLNFEISWHFTIPAGDNPRMGMYDSTSFFIGYWYPQISVYDDIDGWDTYNYTGTQEFYNDFSNYDIRITVPNNFGVWSTGVLQNPGEVLTKNYLDKYNQAHSSDSVIHIVTSDDIDKGTIYSSKKSFNTWHYKAQDVTDFAFGTSDHYLWDGVSLAAENADKQRVYIAAVYRKQSLGFYQVCKIARDAINYFSFSFPGIPFPYPSLAVFNGDAGGMEFPMIVNDGSYTLLSSSIYVTSHEIAHTYFPFYMGTDERKYAWMDEGMATFIPYKFQAGDGRFDPEIRDAFIYDRAAGNETEMPPMIPSIFLNGFSYDIASYMRPGLAYHFLEDAIGETEFKNIFQKFIKTWHGKHTRPYDFFFTFNNLYGKNLDWFWNPWFFERGFPDLAIKSVDFKNDSITISIKKIGIVPVPVAIAIEGAGGKVDSLYDNTSIWNSGKDEIVIKDKLNFQPLEVHLGNSGIPDVDKSNNEYLFKERSAPEEMKN